MTERLVSLQGQSAKYFIFAECFESRDGNGGHGDGIAESVKNFDRVPFGTVGSHVGVYQLHDITTTETMRGKIARQCHIGVQLKLHPVLISSMPYLRGVAEAALYCA
jgi:hypothetical protein